MKKVQSTGYPFHTLMQFVHIHSHVANRSASFKTPSSRLQLDSPIAGFTNRFLLDGLPSICLSALHEQFRNNLQWKWHKDFMHIWTTLIFVLTCVWNNHVLPLLQPLLLVLALKYDVVLKASDALWLLGVLHPSLLLSWNHTTYIFSTCVEASQQHVQWCEKVLLMI